MGLSNTAGVLAGVFGTAATGYILQKGTKLNLIPHFLIKIILALWFLKKLLLHNRTTVDSFLNYIRSGSWDDVFKVAVVLYIIGTLVWNFFSTGEKILD